MKLSGLEAVYANDDLEETLKFNKTVCKRSQSFYTAFNSSTAC